MSSDLVLKRRGPGRPAQFDRDRVLDELIVLFWRRGYEAATQDEMLAVTGLSSSTLYRSFGTKADILEMALARYLGWIGEAFVAMENGKGGVADVRAFLDLLRVHLSGPTDAPGCLIVAIMQDPINEDPRIKAVTDRHMQWLDKSLVAAFKRAADAGEVSERASTYLAEVIRAGVLGVLARARAADCGDALRLLDGLCALLDSGC